jgi:hypothetical protein
MQACVSGTFRFQQPRRVPGIHSLTYRPCPITEECKQTAFLGRRLIMIRGEGKRINGARILARGVLIKGSERAIDCAKVSTYTDRHSH